MAISHRPAVHTVHDTLTLRYHMYLHVPTVYLTVAVNIVSIEHVFVEISHGLSRPVEIPPGSGLGNEDRWLGRRSLNPWFLAHSGGRSKVKEICKSRAKS